MTFSVNLKMEKSFYREYAFFQKAIDCQIFYSYRNVDKIIFKKHKYIEDYN